MFAGVKILLPLACLFVVLGACSPPSPEPEDLEEAPSGPDRSGPEGPVPPPDTSTPCVTPPVGSLAPELTRPASGEWVVPGALVLEASGVESQESGAPSQARFEVWSVKNGAPAALVWVSSSRAPASLTEARLAEGAFQAGVTALSERGRYAARVRHVYGPAACEVTGPWSAFRFFRADDASGQLFDEAQVLTFHLEIPPASWAAMNAQALPPDCVPHDRDDHPVTLRLGTRVFPDVGGRVKGGCGSARRLEGKSSFKVDLEAGGTGAELLGREKLTFDNNVQDPSFMNERLGFAFFRSLGVPAPRTAPMRLSVNGELWGLYTQVETLDRRFLTRWFEDKDGELYEGSYWCDLVPENVPAPGEDPDGFCLERKLGGSVKPGEDAYAPLRELTHALEGLAKGHFYPEVLAFFDYDRFLTTWAIEGVIAHWDGYAFDTVNNYHVYRDPSTERWTLIPGGVDQTFGHRLGRGAGTVQNVWTVSGLLAARCLEEADCRAAYATRLEEVTRAFEQAGLEARVRQMHAQISGLVWEDPRKETSTAGYERAVEDTLTFIRERPAVVRAQRATLGTGSGTGAGAGGVVGTAW